MLFPTAVARPERRTEADMVGSLEEAIARKRKSK
jgi:hypothetical protein